MTHCGDARGALLQAWCLRLPEQQLAELDLGAVVDATAIHTGCVIAFGYEVSEETVRVGSVVRLLSSRQPCPAMSSLSTPALPGCAAISLTLHCWQRHEFQRAFDAVGYRWDDSMEALQAGGNACVRVVMC